jgi:dCTP deaminase
MTVFSAQTIRKVKPVRPFSERAKFEGVSYGLSSCGYDIRVDADYNIPGDGRVVLVASLEEFSMPTNWVGIVHDKSTWARRGLYVQNTVIEPGWKGFLTLELTYSPRNPGWSSLELKAGHPIAQVIFHQTDEPTEQPYDGKYQNQKAGPQEAILEE